MNDIQIKNILDELFFDFEENIFINNGIWPRKVNLVFAFADYIDELSDDEWKNKFPDYSLQQISLLKRKAQEGCHEWLKQNIKTLMI